MKLYVAPYAPNPRRVVMFLAEKDITNIEIVTLNLQEGEHRTDEFRAKSPLSQIPTLELDDGEAVVSLRVELETAIVAAPRLLDGGRGGLVLGRSGAARRRRAGWRRGFRGPGRDRSRERPAEPETKVKASKRVSHGLLGEGVVGVQ